MNNNTSPSSEKRCKCGRYITIGEVKNGVPIGSYTCPNCLNRSSLTSAEFYNQFSRMFS